MTRRILVTGGNKGIGRAIVQCALEHADEVFVYLGSRDLGRGQAARDALVAEHPEWSSRMEVVEIDVSRDESVAGAADRIRAASGPLYGVVNNAGIGGEAGELARVIDVNTRGVMRVCEAFLPALDPELGRIVNVTSASGPSFVSQCSPDRQQAFQNSRAERSDVEAFIAEVLAIEAGPDRFSDHGLGSGDAYGLSKALANLYTIGLAQRHPKLRINACTPGFIETDMTRHYAEAKNQTPAEMGMKKPRDGARVVMHLLWEELAGQGWFYGSDAQRSPLDRYRSPGSPPYAGR